MKKRRCIYIYVVLFFSILCLSIIPGIFNARIKNPLAGKPNILLITVCSLRQDHLSCYAYPRLTSPNIDKLAGTSTIFKNCYTHQPWTTDSTRALLTGRYPGVSLDTAEATKLTELLRSAGYKVFGVMGTYAVKKINLDVGFDEFYGPRDPGNLEATWFDPHKVNADVLVDKAIEILKSQTRNVNPVFLWLFFKDPHWKYIPPGPYKSMFVDDELYDEQVQRLKINEDIYDSQGGIGNARLQSADGSFITDKAYYISQYDAEIFYMDEQIGRLLEYIKNAGSFDDWMILFIADHGESLGEDRYFFNHGETLSDATARVPLIVKMPGQTEARTENGLRAVSDIYPTIADLLGTGPDPGIHGKSFLSIAGKKRVSPDPRRKAFLNTQTNLRGCVFDSYKLIWDMNTDEKSLYALDGEEAPVEGYNSSQEKLVEDMTGFILRFFRNKSEEYKSDNLEVLRSLGYIK